jgi:hypothetical protein
MQRRLASNVAPGVVGGTSPRVTGSGAKIASIATLNGLPIGVGAFVGRSRRVVVSHSGGSVSVFSRLVLSTICSPYQRDADALSMVFDDHVVVERRQPPDDRRRGSASGSFGERPPRHRQARSRLGGDSPSDAGFAGCHGRGHVSDSRFIVVLVFMCDGTVCRVVRSGRVRAVARRRRYRGPDGRCGSVRRWRRSLVPRTCVGG